MLTHSCVFNDPPRPCDVLQTRFDVNDSMNAHCPQDRDALHSAARRRQRISGEMADGHDLGARARHQYFSRKFDVALSTPVAAPGVNGQGITHQQGSSLNSNVGSFAKFCTGQKQKKHHGGLPAAADFVDKNSPCDQIPSRLVCTEELYPSASQLKSEASRAIGKMQAGNIVEHVARTSNTPLDPPPGTDHSHLVENSKSFSLGVVSAKASCFSSPGTAMKSCQEKCKNATLLSAYMKKRPRSSEPVAASHYTSVSLPRESRSVTKIHGDRFMDTPQIIPPQTSRNLTGDVFGRKTDPGEPTDQQCGKRWGGCLTLNDTYVENPSGEEVPSAALAAQKTNHFNAGAPLGLLGNSTNEAANHIVAVNEKPQQHQNSFSTIHLSDDEPTDLDTPCMRGYLRHSREKGKPHGNMLDSECRVKNVLETNSGDSKLVKRQERSDNDFPSRHASKKHSKRPIGSERKFKERVRGVSTRSFRRRHQHLDSNHLLKVPRRRMGVDRKGGDEFDNMIQRDSIDQCLTVARKPGTVRRKSTTRDSGIEKPLKRIKRVGLKLSTSENVPESLDGDDFSREHNGLTNPSHRPVDQKFLTNDERQKGCNWKSGELGDIHGWNQSHHSEQNSACEVHTRGACGVADDAEIDDSQSFCVHDNRCARSHATFMGSKFGKLKIRKESGDCNREQPVISRKVDSRNISEHQDSLAVNSAIFGRMTGEKETAADQERPVESNEVRPMPQACRDPQNTSKEEASTKRETNIHQLTEGFDFFEEDVGEIVNRISITAPASQFESDECSGNEFDVSSNGKELNQLTPHVKPNANRKEEDVETGLQCVLPGECSSKSKTQEEVNVVTFRKTVDTAARVVQACDLGQSLEDRGRLNRAMKGMPYSNRMFALFAPESTREKQQPRKVKGLAAVEHDDSEGGQILLRSVPTSNDRQKHRPRRQQNAALVVVDLTRSSDSDEPTNNTDVVPVDTAINKLDDMRLSDDEASKVAEELDVGSVGRYLDALSESESKVVERAFSCKKDTVVVTLKAAGITLHGEDIQKLRGTRWLNDEVINAYVHLINERNTQLRSEGAAPRTYVFNTFFYTRLTSVAGGYDYAGVRRWTSRAHVDVLQHDLLLVPVNLGNHHWVLSGIDMKNQKIIYLDSMHGRDKASVTVCLQRWIYDEVADKCGVKVAAALCPMSWKILVNHYILWRTGVLPDHLELKTMHAGRLLRMPEQGDGGSCGVFTAKTADCLALGVSVYLRQPNVRLVRERMVLDLLRKKLPC